MNTAHARLLGATLAVSLLCPAPARADWPMPRQNPQRTGAASGVSNLSQPAPYWRAFLGGAIASQSLRLVDVDGDDALDLVFTAGGKVQASRVDGLLLWSSPVPLAMVGVADLGGDPTPEVVARSGSQIYVLDLSTGAILWVQPAGLIGTIGGVRVGDLDGDGLADVFVQECACCAVNSGNTGYAYSFGSGLAAPTLLWELPTVTCGAYRVMNLVDVDGDGLAEVTQANPDSIAVLSGVDASTLAQSTPAPGNHALANCVPGNLDGLPGDELVCAFNYASGEDNVGHRVFALRYAAAAGALETLWSLDVGDVDSGLEVKASLVSDLDGDGLLEVVLSGLEVAAEDEVPRTVVLDALSGAPLVTQPGHAYLGAAPLGADPGLVALTRGTDELVSGWRFEREPEPTLTEAFQLPQGETPLVGSNAEQLQTLFLSDAVVVADLDGDLGNELLTRTEDPVAGLRAYTVGAEGATLLGSWDVASGAALQAFWAYPDPLAPLLVAKSDGRLVQLDGDLQINNPPGVAFGGFYATSLWKKLQDQPVAAPLSPGGPDIVVTPDSRGTLVALDGSAASLASPPKLLWQQPDMRAPTIVDDIGEGEPGVVALYAGPDGDWAMRALRADGTVRWASQVGATPLSDIAYGQLDEDAIPDLVVQWSDPSNNALQTLALSGADGAPLWEISETSGKPQPSGGSVADWDGDGTDDFIHQFDATRVLSGVDGAPLQVGGPASNAYIPTILDVDGDGVDEVTLHGGHYPVRTLEKDLETLLWAGGQDKPFQPGAIASCPGEAPRFVGGNDLDKTQLKLIPVSGPSAGEVTQRFFADGAMYLDADSAIAAGALPDRVFPPAVHANLTGLGRPSVVFGTASGWLYAVDPCAATLDFAVFLGATVGWVGFADTDGDGLDEVLASVRDGHLYALAEPPLPAPAWVWDLDLAAGITDTDVDVLVTSDTLSASWAPVEGATSYAVAAVRADGSGFVSDPPWQDVGLATETTLTELPLEHDKRYLFAVRALLDGAPSPDALSDGVTVRFPQADPEPGPEPGPEAEPEPGPEAEPEAEPGAEPEPEAEAELDPGPEPEPEPVPDAGPGADAGSDASPAPEAGGTVDGDEAEGCDCRATPTPARALPAALALLALLWLRRRR